MTAATEIVTGVDFVTIPTDTAPGVYPLCAETPGADTACVPLRVLAPGSTPLFSSSGNNNSFLAFTGLGLVRLVLLAGVLLAVGWFLVRRFRQPHRA